MKSLNNLTKLTRSEMKSITGGKSIPEQCAAYATQQCQNYSQEGGAAGQMCYYQFYEDCVANSTVN